MELNPIPSFHSVDFLLIPDPVVLLDVLSCDSDQLTSCSAPPIARASLPNPFPNSQVLINSLDAGKAHHEKVIGRTSCIRMNSHNLWLRTWFAGCVLCFPLRHLHMQGGGFWRKENNTLEQRFARLSKDPVISGVTCPRVCILSLLMSEFYVSWCRQHLWA